jgi:hypothetical protein
VSRRMSCAAERLTVSADDEARAGSDGMGVSCRRLRSDE